MSDWDEEDDVEPVPSLRDRLSSLRRRAKRRTGGALRAIHLSRWADALDPPLTPWWLRRPLGYREFFADPIEPAEGYTGLAEHFEDVLLSQMRFMDDQKRDKLIREAFTNPDPDMAGRAVEELRWMGAEGRR
ncbi:hypothetical protein LTT66_18230 [Nocardia gipuzkoensis]|uniref:hypothetical protein n=1 Tax=Nocardia gipuzkoensis TaxID=2749991 RepID=UPI001E64E488|nr:hypothetical protein [Nocardia gipuzkoensis]UGT65308.1 hypothetical protein LTT66_18230 [Nocardia gipuzkoensis]